MVVLAAILELIPDRIRLGRVWVGNEDTVMWIPRPTGTTITVFVPIRQDKVGRDAGESDFQPTVRCRLRLVIEITAPILDRYPLTKRVIECFGEHIVQSRKLIGAPTLNPKLTVDLFDDRSQSHLLQHLDHRFTVDFQLRVHHLDPICWKNEQFSYYNVKVRLVKKQPAATRADTSSLFLLS